jgi:DNA-directed RNA polymerase subunit RPC12/RpoP
MALFGKKKHDEDKHSEPDAITARRDAAMQNAQEVMNRGPAADELERAQQYWANKPAVPGAPDMSAMLERAKQMGGPGMAPTDAGAPGSPTWIDAVLHPQSDFMRQCTCDQCGGPKKLPSASAYMYCDYCSALVDYDLRVAIRSTDTITDRTAYAATFNGIGARSRDAKAAGDRQAYAGVRRDFWDAWLTYSPSAASHRVGDPSYREAHINFMTAGNVVTDLDPSYQATEEQVKQAVMSLRRNGMMIEPDSLWPVLDAYIHQRQIATGLLEAAGIPDQDPDHASAAVSHRISMSAMAQGWLTSLSPEAGEELLARTGLQGEYKRIEPVGDGVIRHCGKCGQEFASLPGAKTAICNGCGHQLDVGAAEWPCNGCGGLMTMPSGATETTCPYCKQLVSRVGR